jgi:hypothetical protein
MATICHLWDNISGNFIEEYDTEHEALEYAIDEIETSGPEAVGAWALLSDSGAGPVTMIAEGANLVRHATDSALIPAETARHD